MEAEQADRSGMDGMSSPTRESLPKQDMANDEGSKPDKNTGKEEIFECKVSPKDVVNHNNIGLIGRKAETENTDVPNKCMTNKMIAESNETDDKGTSLSMQSKELDEIPKELLEIQEYQSIYLDFNYITNIPEQVFSNLENLCVLSLVGNDLEAIPETIERLRNLEELYLNENCLALLPDNITKLNKLVILNVIGNELSSLPNNIGHLSSLAKLYIDENQLSGLPNSFGFMQSLELVKASGNQIKELPQSIGYLSKLLTLDVSENKLSSLPWSFSDLPRLQSLDLSENNLKSLPERMKCCGTLRYLHVEANLLEWLPDWFAEMPQILELSVKDNRMKHSPLPAGFGKRSQKLKSLNLAGNFIDELPETIGECCFSLFGSSIRRWGQLDRLTWF